MQRDVATIDPAGMLSPDAIVWPRDFSLTVCELQLNPTFTAWDTNLDGAAPWPFRTRWHRFTAPDGADAHDHPFALEVYIPLGGGGYIEEIFELDREGRWSSWKTERRPRQAFHIPAKRVHRIDRLLSPVVWTHVVTGPGENDWRVYPEAEIRNCASAT